MRDSDLRAGRSSEKWVKKPEDVPNFPVERLPVGIMGIGSHISPQCCSGSKHHDQFYNLGFVIFHVLLVAILK